MIRRPTRFLVLLGALAACRPGATADPAGDPSDSSGVETAATGASALHRYLAVYLDDQQVGGVETSLRRLPDGGIEVKDRFTFTIQRVNGDSVDEFSLETKSVTKYAPDLSLEFEETIKTEAGVVETTRTKVDGEVIVLSYDGPGQSFEKQFPLPDGYRSSRSVFVELLEEYARTGTPAERAYQSFSSDEQRFVGKRMRVEEKIAVPHGDSSLAAYRVVDTTEDGSVVKMVADANYLPISLDMFGTLTARWVDDPPFDLETVAKITSEIPVEGSVLKWWELEQMNLTITVREDDPKLPSLWEPSHYHDVERHGSTYALRLKNTRPGSAETAPALPVAPKDERIARFLQPTPLSQSDDAGIRKAARRIVGDEQNAVLAGAHIVRWVYENLEKEGGVRGSATATEVLASRAGDCTEHAALTVALARAAGIPARNVDGIVFVGKPDGGMLAGYHAWAELWVGEWIAVDAVFAEVGTSARYMSFGYNEPGEPGSGADLSRTIGKISVVIDGYKLFGEQPVRVH